MALDFSDLKTVQVAGEQAQASSAQGKRPRLDFSDLQEKQSQVLTDQTQQAMASVPEPESQKPTVSDIDTPSVTPESPQIIPQAPAAPKATTDRFLKGAGAGGDQDTSALVTGLVEGIGSFARDEGLPTIGALIGAGAAVAFAPATGGVSLTALALLGMGTGAAFGEALEQTGKQANVIPKEASYKPYETYRELAERAAARGNEEIIWTKVGQVFSKGLSPIGEAISHKLFKKPKQAEATSESFIRVMQKDAEVTGAENLTVADMTDNAMMKMVEEFTTFDVLSSGGKKIRKVRESQGKTLGANIAKQLTKQTAGLGDEVSALGNDAIDNFTDAAFDNLNSHGVAALVHVSIKKSRQVRQAVINTAYDSINEAARLGKYNVTVDARELKEGIRMESKALSGAFEEGKGPKLPKSILQLEGLADSSSFTDSYHTLKRMRAELRDIQAAPKKNTTKFRILKDAEVKLEKAMKSAVDTASEQGARMPDGRTFTEVWEEADTLRTTLTADFDNKIIENVIKKSADGDVAAKELAGLYLKDKTYASRIMKILDDPKHLADPATAATIATAKRGIKAEVIKDIFVDFDAVRGIYKAPNHKVLQDRSEALKKLFTEEEYSDMVDLSNSLRYMDKKLLSKSMEHFQKSRTLGMALKSLSGAIVAGTAFTAVNLGTDLEYISGGLGAMWAVSMLGSKTLRSKGILSSLNNLASPKTDTITRREAGIYIMHQIENAYSSQEKSMTPEFIERRQNENEEATELYDSYRK